MLKKQGELAYVYATVLLAIGTLLCIKADLGMSMIAAPSYCLSHLFGGMVGFAEYVFQGALLLLFCLITRMFRWQFLLSFLTALIYGGVLNLFQLLTVSFVPTQIWLRILLFAVGILVSTLSIAFYLNSYFPLSVYELFVKGITLRFGFKFRSVKTLFDFGCLVTSIVLAIIVFGIVEKSDMSSFGGIVEVIRRGGVYIGTIVSTLVNGILIAFFDRKLKKRMTFEARFEKLRSIMNIEEVIARAAKK